MRQAHDPRIEDLHQRASSHYLQGDFDQALASWQELLVLDPDDERAAEGVRLCEMLSLDRDEAPAAGDGVDHSFEFDFDELDADAATDLPDPARQREGIDLGDGDAPPLELGAGAPVKAERAVPFDTDFDASAGIVDGEAQPDAAAAELRRRVDELHAEALVLFEAGEHDIAQSLVNRLLILDEEHTAALALQKRLAAVLDVGEPESAAVADEDLLGTAPPVPPPGDLDLDLPDLQVGPPPSPPPPAGDPAGDVLDDPADAPIADDPLEAAVAAPGRAPAIAPAAARRSRSLSPRLVLGLGAVVVVAAAIVAALMFMGGGAEEPTAAAVAAPAPTPPAPADPAAVAAGGPATTPAPMAALDPQRIESLLADGQAALDRADYQAAILAFDRIIKARPDHREARDKLLLAGERFRELQAQLEQRARATQMFNRGDYRGAMALFYRLPEGPASENVDTFLRNGWYNLGVQSLQAGDCREARKHFTEARTFDDRDGRIASGFALTDACSGERDRGYYDAVEGLGYRDLYD